eukprot:scaffold43744_cov36-Phaeocystis_antarctica.AAC.3
MLGVNVLKLSVNLLGNQIIIPRGAIDGRNPWARSVSRRRNPCAGCALEDLSVAVELDGARRETLVLARARGPRQPPGAALRLFHLVVKVADLLFAAGFAARPQALLIQGPVVRHGTSAARGGRRRAALAKEQRLHALDGGEPAGGVQPRRKIDPPLVKRLRGDLVPLIDEHHREAVVDEVLEGGVALRDRDGAHEQRLDKLGRLHAIAPGREQEAVLTERVKVLVGGQIALLDIPPARIGAPRVDEALEGQGVDGVVGLTAPLAPCGKHVLFARRVSPAALDGCEQSLLAPNHVRRREPLRVRLKARGVYILGFDKDGVEPLAPLADIRHPRELAQPRPVAVREDQLRLILRPMVRHRRCLAQHALHVALVGDFELTFDIGAQVVHRRQREPHRLGSRRGPVLPDRTIVQLER